MSECRVIKVEYIFLGEEEGGEDFLISIHSGYGTTHGKMIVLEQDGQQVRFPVALADVIKDWASGEKA